MWCFVIVVASLTLTSQLYKTHSHQLNGQRHLNNVESFKMVAEAPTKNQPLKTSKPRLLHQKASKSKALKQKPQRRKPMSKTKRYLHFKLKKSFGENYEKLPSYKDIIRRCSENWRQPGRLLNINTAPFVWKQKELCQGKLDLLIAVHTRPTNFARRQLIRETYGSVHNVRGKRVVVAFFVGNSGDKKTQMRIYEEARENRDVIIRDFKEHYRNMSIKHLTVMEWVMNYCSSVKYLVKTDDDVFLNIFHVLMFIDTYAPRGFYCSRTTGAKALRSGKWKLTFREYPKRRLPVYCKGYSYLMLASHAKSLYWCSVFSKPLWIDDVLVGGILPGKLHIPIEGYFYGHGVTNIMPSLASEKIADYMFLMDSYNTVFPTLFRSLWRASLQHSY